MPRLTARKETETYTEAPSQQTVPPSAGEKRIYRLPVFTAPFCQALLEELEHFEHSDMPKGRPNTMNNYGVGEAPSGGARGGREPGLGSGSCSAREELLGPIGLGLPVCKMRSRSGYFEVKPIDICKALLSLGRDSPQGPRVRPPPVSLPTPRIPLPGVAARARPG